MNVLWGGQESAYMSHSIFQIATNKIILTQNQPCALQDISMKLAVVVQVNSAKLQLDANLGCGYEQLKAMVSKLWFWTH